MHKPNPFDTEEIYRLVAAFDRSTSFLRYSFPVIQMTCVTVLWSRLSRDNLIKSWNKTTQWLKKENAEEQLPNMSSADVLIVYSSPKPAWYPALEDLGAMLIEKGVPCCVVAGRKIKYDSKNGLKEIDFDSYGKPTCRLLRKLWIMFISLIAALLVTIACSISKKTRPLVKKAPLFFFEFIESYKNLNTAACLISRLKAKIVITNGEHLPVCSELMFAADAYGSHAVCFYNEWPSSGFIPFMAKEVWTWNEAATEAIRQVLPAEKKIAFNVVGRAEADYLKNIYSDTDIDEYLGRINPSDLPVFLFLMDYDSTVNHDYVMVAKRTFEIIREAAQACTDWLFLLKPRPFQYALPIPGEESINDLSNCRIIRSKCSLGSFLSMKNIKIVCGCRSSGLLTAAALDKYAVRLLIPGADIPIPYIDPVCAQVRTAKELIALFKNIRADNIAGPVQDKEKMFPYRGQVVQRMRDLVLEKLERNKAKF